MTDVPTLRVDKYFHLSTCTGSLRPWPSFLVLFHPKTDLFRSWPYLASLRMPLDLVKNDSDPSDFCGICIHPVAP
jgi:hypothetical protein